MKQMKHLRWLWLLAFFTFGMAIGQSKAKAQEEYGEYQDSYETIEDSVEYGPHAWYPGEFWQGWYVYDDGDKDIAVKIFRESFYDTCFVRNNVTIWQRYRVYDKGIRSLKGRVSLDAFNDFIFADTLHTVKINSFLDTNGKPFVLPIYKKLNNIDSLATDGYGHYFDPITTTPSRDNMIRRKIPILIEENKIKQFVGPIYLLYPSISSPLKYVLDNMDNLDNFENTEE